MQIIDVRIRKIQKAGSMKAVTSITLDNEFVIHDIRVIQGDRGLFITVPSHLSRNGGYGNIAHPISSTTRNRMQRKILEQYEEPPEDIIESIEEVVGNGEI